MLSSKLHVCMYVCIYMYISSSSQHLSPRTLLLINILVSMEKKPTVASSFCLLLLCVATSTVAEVLEAHPHLHHQPHKNDGSIKLFVFGDSYADTGNVRKSVSPSWKEPYGITFPGKPAGRFSDGRVLTDYLAQFLGIRSPLPYALRKYAKKSKLENGMNFAYGGTGVFDTLVSGPNLTTQIGFFQQLLEQEKVYDKRDLIKSSVALVSVAGNDYTTHFVKPGNGSKDLAEFTKSIVKQIAVDLMRIRDLGVRKIAVTALEPMGCLPLLTSFLSYQNCSETLNLASMFHNQVLRQNVEQLNKESKKSAFIILDLYGAFLSAIKPQKDHQAGKMMVQIDDPLKPCCVGLGSEYSCGSVDESTGAKKYGICSNPERSFFWDTVHLSQNGWNDVYSSLKSSLHQLYS
ncbi:GDSL esterase/lipase At5g03610-like isoform X1 [Malus sylvestris]|uniref:GDSL esterase/lipase At5g03610-like isoform X1 n=1 Tax=Malus sylvestris TaxID=3752 RepID=UPI0021AC6C2D|nr:GDSL esterase/lipase At5g03610-like isoform X1 [Malus sylvestris]